MGREGLGPHALALAWHGGSSGPHAVAWLGGWGCSGSGCSPGSVSWGYRAHAVARHRWAGGGWGRLPVRGQAAVGCRRALGCRRCGGVAVQLAVRAAGQLPAALMDRPVVGSAQQGQVGQVGGAAMEPVAHVVGFAPGQGPGAVREDTAAVPHRQGGALGGLDDPGGPSDLQGLGGGATQGRGQLGRGGSELGRQPVVPARAVGFWWCVTAGVVAGSWGGCLTGGVVVGVVVTGQGAGGSRSLGSPPRHRPAAGTPRGPAARPTRPHLRPHGGGPAGCPGPRSRSAGAGPHRSGAADRPPGARRASSVRASALRWLPLRVSLASAGRANGSRAASRLWPASGSSSPSTATMPSKVGASHSPRRAWRRSRSRSAPSGSATWSRWPRSRRSRPGSSRRAASTSTGSASAVTWSGSGWVPAATTWAWATDSSPSHTAWAVSVSGPGTGPGRSGPPWWPRGRPDGAGCAARPRSSRPGGRARRRRRRGRRRRPVP